jgi:CRISPR-associated protein Csc1
MRPTPLVMQASYEGAYVELEGADPDNDSVRLPADVTFLGTKR